MLCRPDELDFPVCVDHRSEARRRSPEEAGVVAPWRMVRRLALNNATFALDNVVFVLDNIVFALDSVFLR